jgi:16S rRNA (uracil1498-N3)-methyltransferase
MSLPRVIVPGGPLTPGHVVTPDPDTAHHLRVLRLRRGDSVVVVDSTGAEHLATVESERTLRVGEPRPAAPPGPPIRLVLALLKSDHTELALRMATEAGVVEVRVAVCERSVPRPGAAEAGRRTTRLARVASEAAVQCGRGLPPAVSFHADLAAAIADLAEGPRCRLDEGGAPSLASLLAGTGGGAALAVGPEGSFSPAEVRLLDAAVFRAAGLGPRVLRAETAAIAAVVVAQAVAGDMR